MSTIDHFKPTVRGIDIPDDAIQVQVGRMQLAFPAGTPQATIDRKVKQVQEAPRKAAREAARYLRMDAMPKPLKRPTVDMLRCAGLDPKDPEWISMPEDLRRAGMLDLARKRYAAWLKNPKGDPDAEKYRDSAYVRQVVGQATDEDLERLIESNLKPGALVDRKFAATLVECWDERVRRAGEGQAA